MPRNATSEKHESSLTPPATPPVPPTMRARGLRLGGAVLEISPTPDGRVAMHLATDDAGVHASGSADPKAMARWCHALTMLVDASIELRAADAVEIRSPMLPVEGIGWLALWRWLGGSEITLRLLLAHSPEELVAGDETAVLFVTEAEVRELSHAMTEAAVEAGRTSTG